MPIRSVHGIGTPRVSADSAGPGDTIVDPEEGGEATPWYKNKWIWIGVGGVVILYFVVSSGMLSQSSGSALTTSPSSGSSGTGTDQNLVNAMDQLSSNDSALATAIAQYYGTGSGAPPPPGSTTPPPGTFPLMENGPQLPPIPATQPSTQPYMTTTVPTYLQQVYPNGQNGLQLPNGNFIPTVPTGWTQPVGSYGTRINYPLNGSGTGNAKSGGSGSGTGSGVGSGTNTPSHNSTGSRSATQTSKTSSYTKTLETVHARRIA